MPGVLFKGATYGCLLVQVGDQTQLSNQALPHACIDQSYDLWEPANVNPHFMDADQWAVSELGSYV